MSCSTALSFSFSNVIRYHNLSSLEDKRRVLDLYLENFSAHRISPFDPAPQIHCAYHGNIPFRDLIGRRGINQWQKPLITMVSTLLGWTVSGLGSGDFTSPDSSPTQWTQ